MEAPASTCIVIHMGKELSSHVSPGVMWCRQAYGLAFPPVLQFSEKVRGIWAGRGRSDCVRYTFIYLFFLFCECTAVGEDSPLIELASGLRLLVETTSSLPAERHLGWLIVALWRQLAQPAKLLGVHKGTTKSVITEWGKTPYAWDLGHVLYSLTWWSCCRQRFLLFTLLKEKRLKKGAAQDLSLRMLLAPSSVFVLEMQAEILKCSFAPTAPTLIF